MKPGFHHKLLNGAFEDPCLFVRLFYEKRALLFDLGNISRLAPADLFKVTDVFVTHTHIDHFIGFDTLLRTVLRRETPLNVYGPSNILACIEGKLKGYSWNLIRDYPTLINVFSYNGKTVLHSLFSAKNRFRKKTVTRRRSDGLLFENPVLQVRAAALDHGIPCLAFSLEEKLQINIDKDTLARMGLAVGPWLTELKKMLRDTQSRKKTIHLNGKDFSINELSVIARISRGQKISYATDVAMTAENRERLISLVRDSDIFYCEAYFLERDRERALERFHLTAKECGSIAKKAGVKKLAVMHFSPKYRECPDIVVKEAMDEFCR